MYVAFTIRKNAQGRCYVAGWFNREMAHFACEPTSLYLWNESISFGNEIAETNDIAGAIAILPNNVMRVKEKTVEYKPPLGMFAFIALYILP